MTNPDDPYLCVACGEGDPGDSQVCAGCQTTADRDLDAWPNLLALLPAAILPNLAQPIDRGARGRETPLPGGDALNLTGPCNAEVRLRFVAATRIVTDGRLVTVDGEPVRVVVRRREPVLDLVGRPVLVPDGDQVGDIDPDVLLARWCTDLAEARGLGERGAHVEWLRERLPWAYERWDGIGPVLTGLHNIVDAMRSVLDVRPHEVRYPHPCPDPRCNRMALWRLIDPLIDPDDYRMSYIVCKYCGRLWEIDDERIVGQQRRAA